MLNKFKNSIPLPTRTLLHKSIVGVKHYLAGRPNMLPNFLIIGVQKAATTSLFHYLSEHPDIAEARRKEIDYFAFNYFRGLNWYRSFFPPYTKKIQHQLQGKKLITGEASPNYMIHPLSAQRVARQLEKVKLIVLLRDPVDRTYSHYQMNARKGLETLTFEEAIEKENERLAGEVEKIRGDVAYGGLSYRLYSYILRSLYADQLTDWFQHFPREQFLIIKSEALLESPETVMSEIFQFLEIPTVPVGSNVLHHHSTYDSLSPEMRKRLNEFFKPHNERLYQLIGASWRWGESR
jgi:hypothetical protein